MYDPLGGLLNPQPKKKDPFAGIPKAPSASKFAGIPQATQSAPSLTPKQAPSFTDWMMEQATAPIKQGLEGVGNVWSGTGGALFNLAQGKIPEAIGEAQKFLPGVAQTFTAPMAPAINAAKNIPQFVQDTIQTAQPSFEKTLAGAGQVGRGFQQGNVKDVVYGGAKTLSGGIGTVFSPVGGMMQQLPREIQQGAGVLGQGFSALRGAVPTLTGQVDPATGKMTDTGEFMGDVFDIGMTALPFAGKGIAKAVGKTKTGQAIKEGASMFKQDIAQGYAKNIKPNLERINTAIQKPVGVAFDKFGNIPTQLKKGAGKAGETALTVGYGIMPETQQILKNADKNPYWQAAQKGEYSSQKFLENTAQSIQGRMKDLSNTGKIYDAVRENQGITVQLPGDVLRETLKEQFKLPIDSKGMVRPSVNAKVILKPTEVARIQEVLDIFDEVGGTTMDANQFLNIRQSLDDMSRWDAGVNTGVLENISKNLRRRLDSFAPAEIKALDAVYAPEIKELGKIKPYIFDKYGNVKDSAESFLTNLGNRNKSTQFGKLSNSIPDLKLQVDTIKALRNLEDIGNTIGQGSSITNRRLAAGAVGASLGSAVPIIGNIVGGAAGLLLSDPAVAMKAIQGASALKKMFKGTPKSTASVTPKVTFRGAVKQSGQELAGVAKDIQKNMSGLKGGFIDTDLLTGKKPTTKSVVGSKAVDTPTFTLKDPVTVYRGEGKGIGNTTFVNGKYYTDNKKLASTFGDVHKDVIPAGSKVFDFDAIKNNPNQKVIPKQTLMEPKKLTEYLIDKGYTVTKNTTARGGIEFVKLRDNLAELTQIAKKFKNKSDFLEYFTKRDLPADVKDLQSRVGFGDKDYAWRKANGK